jgi:hypothetical protein
MQNREEVRERLIQDNVGVPIESISVVEAREGIELWRIMKLTGYSCFIIVYRSNTLQHWFYYIPTLSQIDDTILFLKKIKELVE